MEKTTILAVDDQKASRYLLEFHLKKWGFKPLLASGGTEALEVLRENAVDLILSDQTMPRMDGMEFLKIVKSRYAGIPFIMVTAHGSIEKAVASIKEGAYDYIQKPFNRDELLTTIKRALSHYRLSEENKKLKDHLRCLYSFQNIVTKSSLMMNALNLAEKVAENPNTTVVIYGESGTGKEVLARAIHFAGERMENRFVAVNCAGIPTTLLESELFGHVKGAFTGADSDREGKFDVAQHGTLLLDEIGDMPFDIQAKLLRILQERTYEKLGSNKPVKTDFRVIATTHRNLKKLVKEGQFREDLYHRINSFPITLPPLRERKEDIPFLTDHFLNQLRNELGKQLPGISQEAMNALLRYHWPGNIRELKNCVERAAIMTGGELIRSKHLIICEEETPADEGGKMHIPLDFDAPDVSLDNIIGRVLQTALERCNNNKSLAAELLKVNRKIFYRSRKV